MTSENQRSEPRLDARLKVWVVRGRSAEAFETADVSFRGLFLRTATPLALRSLVRLRIELPLGQIEAHAMIVYISDGTEDASDARGAGMGVQFWGLGGDDREGWNGYVRELIVAQRIKDKQKKAESGVRVASPGAPVPTPIPHQRRR